MVKGAATKRSATQTSTQTAESKKSAEPVTKKAKVASAPPPDSDEDAYSEPDESESDDGDDDDHSDQDSEDAMSEVQVDFDFFDLSPTDFHAVDVLMKQLLGPDAVDFEFGGVADLLLESSHLAGGDVVGTTCKVIDEEDEDQRTRGADPYAFVAAVDLAALLPPKSAASKAAPEKGTDVLDGGATLAQLLAYIKNKGASDKSTAKALDSLDLQTSGKTALLLSERLINMPLEVAPALYGYLSKDLQKAGRRYDRYVLLSRCYTESAPAMSDSDDDDDDDDDDDSEESEVEDNSATARARAQLAAIRKEKAQAQKQKQKELAAVTSPDLNHFHEEDSLLQSLARAYTTFDYTHTGTRNADSRRAFNKAGFNERGAIYILDSAGLDAWIKQMTTAFSSQ
ncbi:Mss4p nuclear export [Savitreella phatthalungensis]